MKIYLAIPYTFNPELSHKIANKVTAELMNKGHVVFSPISHSHHIADHLPDIVRTDSDWWMSQDLPFVEWAEKLIVVLIGEFGSELAAKSKGVQMELNHAKKHGKQIEFYEYFG